MYQPQGSRLPWSAGLANTLQFQYSGAMKDVPDDPAMRLMAAREAVARLGLLKPAAEPTIVTLLENRAGEHPRTAATAWRKAGEQLPAEEKRMLGIGANAFFSRQALDELGEKGFADPLRAHELTLLRATFVMFRHRNAVSYRKVMAENPRVRMAVRYDAFHHESCDVCKSLHDTPVGADWGLFAPDGCTCLTAPHGLRLDADWLGPEREAGPGGSKPGTPTFLERVRSFLTRV